jgi:prephenate dehydratase
MSDPLLVVFRGKNSQTGQAFLRELPEVSFNESNAGFDEVRGMIQTGSCVTALPIWNSHQGEIEDSKVIAMLLEDKARICRLWPKEIIFCCVSRTPSDQEAITTIISIRVAKAQCSAFLAEQRINVETHFTPAGSTTEAYAQFDANTTYDAVLCAPGTHNPKYSVFRENAANPLNFTAFVILGSEGCETWLGRAEWKALHPYLGASVVYAGVEMPIPEGSEDTEDLFEALVSRAKTVDELPKVVFAARRSATRCAIIVEATEYPLPSNLIREGGEAGELVIHPDLGSSAAAYAPRAQTLVAEMILRVRPDLAGADFIRHQGKETFFFACPALGMLTHGFEKGVVEDVFRQYVTRCFGLIENETISCSSAQRQFFEKYKQDYYDRDADFIQFAEI